MALVPPTPKDPVEKDSIPKKTSMDTTLSNVKKPTVTSDPSRTVRTSSRDQKLDKHRYHNTSISIPKKSITSSSPSSGISPLASIVFLRKIKLTSIEILRQSIDEECDTDLLNIIRNFVYVGTIDGQSSLIQHDTQLYLVHTRHLSQELFYQLCLYHFGNMGTIRLEPEPPSIEVIYNIHLLTFSHDDYFVFRNYFVLKQLMKK
jgi:DNA mismatch repair protein MLH1